MVRLSLVLLLMCACASASAREVRLQSPNGETGTCPEVEAQAPANAAPKTAARAPARKPAAKPAAAPSTTQGGGGDASVRGQGPRWHSFLPGMFR